MCWQMRKTLVKFPDCKGRTQGDCINFDPVEDYIQWCMSADQRGSVCDSPAPTTQSSSTRRGINCPRHRGNTGPGAGGQGSGRGAGQGGGGEDLPSGPGSAVHVGA
ncbi:hypothetical protein BDV10DRAFT_177933 [Aspergillus recurvatus]